MDELARPEALVCPEEEPVLAVPPAAPVLEVVPPPACVPPVVVELAPLLAVAPAELPAAPEVAAPEVAPVEAEAPALPLELALDSPEPVPLLPATVPVDAVAEVAVLVPPVVSAPVEVAVEVVALVPAPVEAVPLVVDAPPADPLADELGPLVRWPVEPEPEALAAAEVVPPLFLLLELQAANESPNQHASTIRFMGIARKCRALACRHHRAISKNP